MPKHSSGNFKNSNHNLSSDHHQQPQNFSQQLEQVRGGTTTTHLSYENLSSSVPSGGAHSTNNPMYFQQHENSPHQQHPNSQLTNQQINAVTHHQQQQQLTTYASIHQKSNQALNHIQPSEPSNHYGSFGNITTAAPRAVGGGGGVISSGVSSSSTTSLDETQNGLSSQQQQTGSRNNINNLNSEQQCMTTSADQIALPEGWDMGRDYDGKIYFIDHRSQTTTWVDPRER